MNTKINKETSMDSRPKNNPSVYILWANTDKKKSPSLFTALREKAENPLANAAYVAITMLKLMPT